MENYFFVFSGYKSLHEFDNATRLCIQLLCLMSCFQVDGRLLSLTCRKYAIAIQNKTFYFHKQKLCFPNTGLRLVIEDSITVTFGNIA